MNNTGLAVSPSGKLVPFHKSPLVAILDDEPVMLELMSGELAENGFQTITYSSKDECLAQLSRTLPDVIISDIVAPGMSGIDFLRVIKSHSRFKDIPVMIISGSIPDRKTEAMRLGAFACLPKPLDLNSIVRTVRRAIEEL